MHVFVARSGNRKFIGTPRTCIQWANEIIEAGPAESVRLLRGRPDTKRLKVLMHISVDGVRQAKGFETR